MWEKNVDFIIETHFTTPLSSFLASKFRKNGDVTIDGAQYIQEKMIVRKIIMLQVDFFRLENKSISTVIHLSTGVTDGSWD